MKNQGRVSQTFKDPLKPTGKTLKIIELANFNPGDRGAVWLIAQKSNM